MERPGTAERDSAFFTVLKRIAAQNRKRLLGVFALVGVENLLFLTYPLIAGFAVNAVIARELWIALAYALVVLLIWGIGSARRVIDTRTFVRIYAELAVQVALVQRERHSTSTAAARVALSRRFVDFFEEHLPIFITSLCSIVGSALMLLLTEFWAGIVACAILLFFCALLPRYAKINDLLYGKLNNHLEQEVDIIGRSKPHELIRHYGLLSRIRIGISNREAFGFLCIGLSMCLLFGVTLAVLTLKGYGSAGHIYTVITYCWTFAISLDDGPRLLEEYSNLRDIGWRVRP